MNRRGFTLTELVVVLIIIALLAAAAAPRFSGVLEESRRSRIETDLAALMAAGESYARGADTIPAETPEQLVTAGYLREVPQSPVNGYHYTVHAAHDGVRATLSGKEGVYEQNGYRAEKDSRGFYPA